MCSLLYTFTNPIARSSITTLHLRVKPFVCTSSWPPDHSRLQANPFRLHILLTSRSSLSANISTLPRISIAQHPSHPPLHPSPVVGFVRHFVRPSIVVHRHLERWITHPAVTKEPVIHAEVLRVGRVHDRELFAFFDVAFRRKDQLAVGIVVAVTDNRVAGVIEARRDQEDAR